MIKISYKMSDINKYQKYRAYDEFIKEDKHKEIFEKMYIEMNNNKTKSSDIVNRYMHHFPETEERRVMQFFSRFIVKKRANIHDLGSRIYHILAEYEEL